MAEDDRLEYEDKKAHAEYIGMFAGPEVYLRVKGLHKDQEPADTGPIDMPFRIVRDTSAFTERLNRAMAGEAVYSPDRPDIAEKIKSKRVELAKEAIKKRQSPDPRIREYPTDELVIERPAKPDA